MKQKEALYKQIWRPAAAFVYLFICMMDFAFMPIYYEYLNNKYSNVSYVELALKFQDGAAQIEALRTLKQTRVWQPITLQATGLFHIAFGAILGVTAWTRGQEKLNAVQMVNTAAQQNPYDPQPQPYQYPYQNTPPQPPQRKRKDDVDDDEGIVNPDQE